MSSPRHGHMRSMQLRASQCTQRTGTAVRINSADQGDRVMAKRTKKSTSNKSSKATKGSTPKRDPDLVPLTKSVKTTAMKLSCLDAAAQVLKDKGEPMNCKAMIEVMFAKKLWHTDAPTPA